jgi:hypothetical protein
MRRPEAIWQAQPEERIPMNMEQIVNRRADALSYSTRSEIRWSLAAAVFFLAVILWRLPPREPLEIAGFGVIVLWVVTSLAWYRGRIWRAAPPPDAIAATGIAHYRKELEIRRDHLRNAWLWHGPLLLACAVFAAGLSGGRYFYRERLIGVAPFAAILLAWTMYDIRRRYRQAAELQREIDEIDGQN